MNTLFVLANSCHSLIQMAVGKFSKYPRKNKHKHIRMSKPDVEKERKKKKKRIIQRKDA